EEPQLATITAKEQIPVQEPQITVQEPQIAIQEPQIAVQEPQIVVQEPQIVVQESQIPVQEPQTPVQESQIPVQEPQIPVQEPQISIEEPQISIEEPQISVEESQIPVQESQNPVQELQIPVQEPQTPVQESLIPVQESQTLVQEPQISVQEPQIPIQEPQIPIQESQISVQEPQISVQEPQIPVQESQIAVLQQIIAQNKSIILDNEVERTSESNEILRTQPPPSNPSNPSNPPILNDYEVAPGIVKNEDNLMDTSADTSVETSVVNSDYSSVIPPSSLTSSSNPGSQVEFNTAMAKVKEIAAKLGVKPTVDTTPLNKVLNVLMMIVIVLMVPEIVAMIIVKNIEEILIIDVIEIVMKIMEGEIENGNRHRYGLGSEERRSHHGSHYGPGSDLPRSTTHEEFKVPNAVVGLVIGRGGENLKRIEKQTGARIQFSQDQPPDVVERRVTITGTMEDVKNARGMVQQLVEDAINGNSTSRRDSGSNRSTITIHIPSSKVGVVIGRGGETIRDLQDRSGARINVTPDSAASPQSNDRPVTLIGDEAAVQRAKALIDEIVNTGESISDRGHKEYRSNSYSGASTYSNDSHGSYGPSGETVRALQQQSGAKIQIEPVHGAPPVERNVQIIGSSENIAIAKQLILEKAASGNRERSSRHGDQGRGDYTSGGYQQSSYQHGGNYQQGSYQQGNYQQGNYQQGGYQQGSYQQISGYQQSSSIPANNTGNQGYQQNNGYSTNAYPQSQQLTYGQSTNNDYAQTTAVTYSQYPAQAQYNTYGQPTQYSQMSTGQSVGQTTGQPVVQQQVGQPSNQPQAVDPNKLGQSTEVKSDSQPVAAVPNYGYQYGYSNYGTTPVATTQFPNTVGGQTQVTSATVTQIPGAYSSTALYGTPTANTAVNPPTSSAPGTVDQNPNQQQQSYAYYTS
ncbi:9993_t:CDS:10, partial [Diversispora eburnea]